MMGGGGNLKQVTAMAVSFLRANLLSQANSLKVEASSLMFMCVYGRQTFQNQQNVVENETLIITLI
jgi:hypothetical protein